MKVALVMLVVASNQIYNERNRWLQTAQSELAQRLLNVFQIERVKWRERGKRRRRSFQWQSSDHFFELTNERANEPASIHVPLTDANLTVSLI